MVLRPGATVSLYAAWPRKFLGRRPPAGANRALAVRTPIWYNQKSDNRKVVPCDRLDTPASRRSAPRFL
jgi:hypothetical protein